MIMIFPYVLVNGVTMTINKDGFKLPTIAEITKNEDIVDVLIHVSALDQGSGATIYAFYTGNVITSSYGACFKDCFDFHRGYHLQC